MAGRATRGAGLPQQAKASRCAASGTDRHEAATDRPGGSRGPGPPVLADRPPPRQAARMLERRPHDLVDEAFGSDPQHLELQLFLRIEMGEETTLGEPELACQGCQTEPVEAFASREPESDVEDAVSCLAALCHGSDSTTGRAETQDEESG